MRKIKCYLDTSILNFLFAEDDVPKRDITAKFFDQLHIIADQVFISDEVIKEIGRAPEPIRSQLMGLLEKIKPLLLEFDIEAEELAKRYVREGIIPERYKSDAIHIAIAVINKVEVIISWNFEHIVKLKTRIMVNEVNRSFGYHDIEICSPNEVVEI